MIETKQASKQAKVIILLLLAAGCIWVRTVIKVLSLLSSQPTLPYLTLSSCCCIHLRCRTLRSTYLLASTGNYLSKCERD